MQRCPSPVTRPVPASGPRRPAPGRGAGHRLVRAVPGRPAHGRGHPRRRPGRLRALPPVTGRLGKALALVATGGRRGHHRGDRRRPRVPPLLGWPSLRAAFGAGSHGRAPPPPPASDGGGGVGASSPCPAWATRDRPATRRAISRSRADCGCHRRCRGVKGRCGAPLALRSSLGLRPTLDPPAPRRAGAGQHPDPPLRPPSGPGIRVEGRGRHGSARADGAGGPGVGRHQGSRRAATDRVRRGVLRAAAPGAAGPGEREGPNRPIRSHPGGHAERRAGPWHLRQGGGGGLRVRAVPVGAAGAINRSRRQAISRPDEVWLPYVSAAPAREHLAALSAAGMGLKTVARLSGVSHGSLSKIVYGEPRQGRPPSRRVRPETLAKILAVRATDARGGQRVGAESDVAARRRAGGRRLQQRFLARALGARADQPSLQIGKTMVRASTARAVQDLHRRLLGARPVPAGRDEMQAPATSSARPIDRGRFPGPVVGPGGVPRWCPPSVLPGPGRVAGGGQGGVPGLSGTGPMQGLRPGHLRSQGGVGRPCRGRTRPHAPAAGNCSRSVGRHAQASPAPDPQGAAVRHAGGAHRQPGPLGTGGVVPRALHRRGHGGPASRRRGQLPAGNWQFEARPDGGGSGLWARYESPAGGLSTDVAS